ncbi:MAG: SDR family NAD(P)-dependent oxidoreductase [Janthinobacterium lividum]
MTASSHNNLFSLEGKVALVTGAGRGLGADIARALAAAGAQVFALSRSQAELETLAESIKADGGRCEAIVCDVLDDSALQHCIGSLASLDILVNNAGMNIPQRLESVSVEQLDAVLNLNVRASFLAMQAAIRKMQDHPQRQQLGGAIVNISSQMGHVGAERRTVYCMTKHALEGLTKAAAVELAPQNIRVNTVAPTFIDTPMTRPFFADQAFSQWVHERIPMGRLLRSDEVAAAVVYLASPAAAMVTGTSLKLDGGWTAQ